MPPHDRIIQMSAHLLLHLPIHLDHELDLERKRRASKVCLDERGRNAGGVVPAEWQRYICGGTEAVQSESVVTPLEKWYLQSRGTEAVNAAVMKPHNLSGEPMSAPPVKYSRIGPHQSLRLNFHHTDDNPMLPLPPPPPSANIPVKLASRPLLLPPAPLPPTHPPTWSTARHPAQQTPLLLHMRLQKRQRRLRRPLQQHRAASCRRHSTR